jgi:class 3 adenylate cyclase
MTIKTENLAIMMTDIVGYTEATMKQSRSENEQLLATHNRILLPILKQYRGRHIKSIGDALLLVFRSPTDAMLCAMAMQDALHEYNRSATDKPIHIRIAASLGEVRVTRDDIFGEPVNLTSRIEGITPPDEIYLSEAMYMAMNKAEVPAEEVGWKELKGISESVRIYHLPRFANPRLVPEAMSTEDLGELVYPFGGAHLLPSDRSTSVMTQFRHISRRLKRHYAYRIGQPALFALIAIPALIYGFQHASQLLDISPKPAPAQAAVSDSPAGVNENTPSMATTQEINADQSENNLPAVPETHANRSTLPGGVVVTDKGTHTPAPAVSQTGSKTAGQPAKTVASVTKSTAAKKLSTTPATATTNKSTVIAKPVYASVRDAKIAYKKREISEAEYKKAIYYLKVKLKQEIRQAKLDLRAKKISKAEYGQRVRDAELDYAGRR